jgi:small GTP-binding protein
MPKCPSCGYQSEAEWKYCMKCGTPRSNAASTVCFRIVVMGPGGVGKSALTLRFINGTFVSLYDPTIEDRYSKYLRVDDNDVVLDLLDTAGQDTFSALRELYIQNGDGFVLVYAITQKWSFAQLPEFFVPISRRRDDKGVPPVIVVGNKSDLARTREVPTSNLEGLAKEWKADWLEISVKENIGVTETFTTLIRRLLERTPTPKPRRRGCVLV